MARNLHFLISMFFLILLLILGSPLFAAQDTTCSGEFNNPLSKVEDSELRAFLTRPHNDLEIRKKVVQFTPINSSLLDPVTFGLLLELNGIDAANSETHPFVGRGSAEGIVSVLPFVKRVQLVPSWIFTESRNSFHYHRREEYRRSRLTQTLKGLGTSLITRTYANTSNLVTDLSRIFWTNNLVLFISVYSKVGREPILREAFKKKILNLEFKILEESENEVPGFITIKITPTKSARGFFDWRIKEILSLGYRDQNIINFVTFFQ